MKLSAIRSCGRSRSTASPSRDSPRRRFRRSPSWHGESRTSCASSSSCRSTPTRRGAKTTSSPARRSARSSRTTHGPLVELPAKASSTARRFRFADGIGELGFVNPVSEPFCSSCDRIRVTADGQLRTCLFSRREWDLKTPLREGASDEELVELLRFAVRHKELKHKINDPGFVRASRSMSQIGG